MQNQWIHTVFTSLCFFVLGIGHAQNQMVADSLVTIYEHMDEEDTGRLRVLTWICNNQADPHTKLEYSAILMNEAKAAGSLKYLHHAYLNEGQAYRLLGDYDVAIYSLFKALDFAERSKYRQGVAGTQTALADAYSILGNHDNSLLYYRKALHQLTERDSLLRANVLLNMGDEYYMSEVYDSALACFQESKEIYEALGHDRSGLAYNLGNIGLVQAELGNLDQAEQYVYRSIHELENLGDHYGSAIFLSYMSGIYQRKGLLKDAEAFADSSMRISQRYGLKAEIRDNSLRLADIYAMSDDYESAYKYHQRYVELKDSISNDEVFGRIENLESAFELARKQTELDLLKERQKNQQIIVITAIVITLILGFLALVIFRYYKAKSRINKVLEEQKRALEALNETKDKFFSIISHDLRGPISSFHGVSSMIKYMVKSGQTDQLLQVADDIDESVDRMSGLLDNLLNWAMQQQGHFPNVPEKLDLEELVHDLVGTMENMAMGKRIDLSTHIDGQISLWADKNTTLTILRNIVNNALKFTPEGGKVVISATERGDMASIRVEDTGVGMPKDKLKKLFRLQDKKSTYGTAGEKGLGLGLQLVYEFVEMNRGKITVESVENEGTVFTLELPLFEVQEVKVTPG